MDNTIPLTDEQKLLKKIESQKRAKQKYYNKTCKLHPDMTEEEKTAVLARINKRRQTSSKYHKNMVEQIKLYKEQLKNIQTQTTN